MGEGIRWREPTSTLPLRWGSYTGRYLTGLTLILSGGIGLQGANPYMLFLLIASTAAHATGWLILPGKGKRRIWGMTAGVVTIWLLLPGPQALTLLVIPFVAWLAVRERPLRSYVTVVLVLATGVINANIFREYSGMPAAILIVVGAVVASTWVARYAAALSPLSPATSNPQRAANTIDPETVDVSDS